MTRINISEIFKSIQGESSFAGYPCIFIRTKGCNLRCNYCDTQYAYDEGESLSMDQVLDKVKELDCKLVEITGGEPLLQKGTAALAYALLKEDCRVLLETNGSFPLQSIDERVSKIIDIKCPGSGMDKNNCYTNLDIVSQNDEVKFIISDRRDFDWAVEIIRNYSLTEKTNVLFSSNYQCLKPHYLADWLLDSKINARMQLQLHKYIWGSNTRN